MKKSHPHLKDHNVKKGTKTSKPTMTGVNLFKYINNYVEWLHDEKLRNGRKYMPLEQLMDVLDQLDDEAFEEAKKNIEEKIESLNLNSRDPKPIPEYLHVNSKLGLYIVDQLPLDTQSMIYNEIATQLMHETSSSTPVVNKVNSQRYPKPNKKSDTSWAKILKWEIMENKTCPACLRNNHNVYKTGCPTLATFAACKEFYKTAPKDKLEVTKDEFQKFQKEQSKKKRQRWNEDKRAIRTLAEIYDDDDIAQVKKTFFNQYLHDFKDEQFCIEHPYEDLTPEPQHGDAK